MSTIAVSSRSPGNGPATAAPRASATSDDPRKSCSPCAPAWDAHATKTWFRFACTSAVRACGQYPSMSQRAAPQRERSQRLDEAQVVADAQAQPAVRRGRDRQPAIPRCEHALLPAEQVQLAVVEDQAVGAEQHGGVVEAVPRPLREPAGQPATRRAGDGGPGARGLPVNRLGLLVEDLGPPAIARNDQLRQDHDVGATLERVACRGDAQVAVGRTAVRGTADLRDRDARHVGPAAWSIAESGGQGPPTLSTGDPRSALTRCSSPTGTWITSPASNSSVVPFVRSSIEPRPDRIAMVSSDCACEWGWFSSPGCRRT